MGVGWQDRDMMGFVHNGSGTQSDWRKPSFRPHKSGSPGHYGTGTLKDGPESTAQRPRTVERRLIPTEIKFKPWTSRSKPRCFKWTRGRSCRLLVMSSAFFCVFCLNGPFKFILFHKFSRQHSAFWFCSFGFNSALLVLSNIYLLMKVSFSFDIIFCGWLGSKRQLTN